MCTQSTKVQKRMKNKQERLRETERGSDLMCFVGGDVGEIPIERWIRFARDRADADRCVFCPQGKDHRRARWLRSCQGRLKKKTKRRHGMDRDRERERERERVGISIDLGSKRHRERCYGIGGEHTGIIGMTRVFFSAPPVTRRGPLTVGPKRDPVPEAMISVEIVLARPENLAVRHV
jgi:hypothetical protein